MRIALIGLLLISCGDDGGNQGSCGVAAGTPDGAATITVNAQASSDVAWVWGRNNDCNASGSGVVSVTLRGDQSDDSQFGMGFCLPRPDQVGTAPVQLSDTSKVLLVGASRSNGGCTVALAPDAQPTGTITFAGFCPTSSESFLVTLSGSVPGIQTCAGTTTPVTMLLGGQFVVAPQ